MASIDEIIGRIQAASQKVNEAAQSLDAAENTARQLQAAMAAVGVQDKAAQFAQVENVIQGARQHLLGNQEMTNQAINLAKQAGG
ncbi:hypothetical protein GCM10023322_71790 [Rugosimonospora acidiphila]|uniref:Uncharacterized protein n=1 Tax=Rugosimonospora acidiphila TaxID=556531 RepID=A0ABP9SPL5_9ACTN